jgi:hypothetical protein
LPNLPGRPRILADSRLVLARILFALLDCEIREAPLGPYLKMTRNSWLEQHYTGDSRSVDHRGRQTACMDPHRVKSESTFLISDEFKMITDQRTMTRTGI